MKASWRTSLDCARPFTVNRKIQRVVQNERGLRSLHNLESKYQQELLKTLHQEKLVWYQLSNANWLVEGDRNTRFFHVKAMQRKREKNISMIKNLQGQWVDNHVAIEELFRKIFQQFYTEDRTNGTWFLTNNNFPQLDVKTKMSMEAIVSNGDIKRALFGMTQWKSPGPDGFSTYFYQKSWNKVGENVCSFIRNLWNKPKGISEVNYTDLCLIPKIQSS